MEKMMIGDEGKMVIKIKIPKLSAEATAATEGEKTPEQDVIGILSSKTEGKKVCLECKKEFSSGKALGGHMRVHVQSANKNPNFLKPPKTTKINNNGDGKPYYMNSVNDEGKPTCSQCGKTFPSMKSLFGHMRCHPERVWRGILPPPNTPTAASAARRRNKTLNSSASGSGSSSSSENDLSISDQDGSKIDDDGGGGDQVVDLTKFLRGWSVTERRGRRALKPADEDDDVLLEAVEDLMSLANGVVSMTESVITQRQLKPEVTEGSNSNFLTNKGKAVMDEEIDVKASPPAKLELNDVGDNESDGRNTNKRKKIKLMMELEPSDVVPTALPEQQECKYYKCTTCNKCFASHQALGGHRSSHNKPKLTSADRHPNEEADYKSFVMNLSAGENSENGGFNSSVHQCKICDKIFATGQALGGHQRCHWSGANVAQAPSSQITSAGEAGSQTGCDRKVLDFDLNEIPPAAMMEEDGNG